MAYLERLAALEAPNRRIETVFQDEAGLPDLNSAIHAASADTAIYACGPEPMLAAVEKICLEHGRAESLHLERFAAPSIPFVVPEAGEQVPFEVILSKTGCTVTVSPGRSILEVVREIVPDIMSVCEEGFCGACEQRLLEGCADHRDSVLSEDEKATGSRIMICVSRAKSPRLVLEL
jgi:ferredoxin